MGVSPSASSALPGEKNPRKPLAAFHVLQLYLNLTNRCPSACRFCIRQQTSGLGNAQSLWLEREPTFAEIRSELEAISLAPFEQVVFRGYGEPFCALETMLETLRYLRGRKDAPPVRVNTNGLGDLGSVDTNGMHGFLSDFWCISRKRRKEYCIYSADAPSCMGTRRRSPMTMTKKDRKIAKNTGC